MTYRNGSYEKSGNDLCMTPLWLLKEIEEEYGEIFDPCPSNWDESFDGLEIEWSHDKVNFVNPPYSQIAQWANKCEQEWLNGKTVILLIPPRTDTKYFHSHIYRKARLRFIKGRLKFRDPETGKEMASAPFPSMLCFYKQVN